MTAMVAASCSSDPAEPLLLECTEVSGFGTTTGDSSGLHGDATFVFDGVERATGVGIYLINMEPQLDGSFDLNIVYQFTWPNGDLILTDDPVRFAPTLFPDTYTFSIKMLITSGRGMFEAYVGQRPLSIDAEIVFGPPETPGGPPTMVERFEIGGRLCGE